MAKKKATSKKKPISQKPAKKSKNSVAERKRANYRAWRRHTHRPVPMAQFLEDTTDLDSRLRCVEGGKPDDTWLAGEGPPRITDIEKRLTAIERRLLTLEKRTGTVGLTE